MNKKEEIERAKDIQSDATEGYKKLIVVLLLFASILLFRGFVIDRVVVDGMSMADTFQDGHILWARKFNVNQEHIKRFDVVNVKIDGELYIKRIIGLPGETIQIKDGFVFINGEKLADDYGDEIAEAGLAQEAIFLSENEYFIMGDNRNDSADSRVFGKVGLDEIKSVNIFRIFPFHKIGRIETQKSEG